MSLSCGVEVITRIFLFFFYNNFSIIIETMCFSTVYRVRPKNLDFPTWSS